MTKTLVLDDVQQTALRFCLGGRHRLQADPPVILALGEIEAQLNASTEESPEVAPEEGGTVSPVGEKAAGIPSQHAMDMQFAAAQQQSGQQLAALSGLPQQQKAKRGRK